MKEPAIDPTPTEKMFLEDADLVDQIYCNMVNRGILDYDADEIDLDKSELKILAYHVRKNAKAQMKQEILDKINERIKDLQQQQKSVEQTYSQRDARGNIWTKKNSKLMGLLHQEIGLIEFKRELEKKQKIQELQ